MSAKINNTQETRAIDPNVLQRKAATPTQSVWVGASAGSGKTKVLVDRIVRLLLPDKDGRHGAAPYKILALTFTKAAASEMRLRIQETLGEWAVLPIEKVADGKKHLTKELADILGHAPTDYQIKSAQGLFNTVIDSPGGINIMTIHSFCQSVLGRFPLEAGLKPNFKAMEDSETAKIVEKSKAILFKSASQKAGSPLSYALTSFTNLLNDDQFSNLLNEIIGERKQVERIITAQFDHHDFYNAICDSLHISAQNTLEKTISQACNPEDYNQDQLYIAVRELIDSNNKNDQARGINIKYWLELDHEQRIQNFDTYLSIFLTDKDTVRKTLAVKATIKNNPEIENILNEEAIRLFEVSEQIKKYKVAHHTNNFLVIAQYFLDLYQQEKTKQNALDYDDLILYTNNLLNGKTERLKELTGTASWIRYKMDQGIDHILVDEAQDTNPEQWEIIQSLTDDFFAHQDESSRSLFVVGDEKQSIYSFQRASPEKFDEMRDFYQEKINNSAQTFEEVDFITSFRSTPAVLSFVDAVYAEQNRQKGLGNKTIEHQSFRAGQPGNVTLWPVFEDDEKKDIDAWAPPTQIISHSSGASKMADYIGNNIEQWIKEKRRLYSYDRPLEAGDILILLRSRNKFLDQLVRALKIRNIPVSGVDRLVLNNHLAVQDLMAAAQFVLLPEDDLNLAGFLKSPFIGLDEEALFELAHKRTSTLWSSLKESNNSDIYQWLKTLRKTSKNQNPYEFFNGLLNLSCPQDSISGLRAMRSRLGDEISDPIEEFLNLSLSASKDHGLSLQAFIQEQLGNQSQIKREMEEGSGKVRIMTVHGAKGLQAPIVILPDTVRNSASIKTDKILWPQKTGAAFPYYCASSKDIPDDCLPYINKIKDKNDEEYRRLFYVAATRAESELYIGGYKGSKKILEESWYNYTLETMNSLPDILEKECLFSGENTFTHFNPAIDDPDYKGKNKLSSDKNIQELPTWSTSPIQKSKLDTVEIYRPSDSLKVEKFLSPFNKENDHRFKRGNIIHALLQILPDLKEDDRLQTAEIFLKRPIHGLKQEDQQDIIKEIFKLLENFNFKQIFSTDAQAEVAITGSIDGKLVIGKIDRLLVTANEVLIIDFKTNRPPPTDQKNVPKAYLEQLNSYEAVLKKIYPQHKFKKALLWTNTAQLMELT